MAICPGLHVFQPLLKNINFQSNFILWKQWHRWDLMAYCLDAVNSNIWKLIYVFQNLFRNKERQTPNSTPLKSTYIIFSIWLFFHDHSRFTGLQGKVEGISLTPQCHFKPFHRHLDFSRAITADSLPLRIGSSQTQTGNLWFQSVSR